MHGTEGRFVIGPSNMLFACVYVCTFQPGNVTGQGSEGVNKEDMKYTKQDYDPENNAFTYLMSKFAYIYIF